MLLWLAAACAPEPAEPPDWAEVQPIVARSCTGCHQPGAIGGFALQTHADVVEWLEPVRLAVHTRDMPPWDAAPVRPYHDDPSLTDAEIALITEWIDAGAPEGDTPVDPVTPPPPQRLDQVDVSLSMPEPYTPIDSGTGDDYRCFALDWPDDAEPWITGLEIEPGNLTSVHHVVAFVVPPHLSEVVDGFVSDDGRPGYPCFGGASMDGWEPADLTETFVQALVGQWAPGSNPIEHVRSGLPIDPGSRVVLQMHYSPSSATDDGTDQTTVHVRTAPSVERVGASIAWLDILWILDPMSMRIAAGEAGVVHSFRAPLSMSPGITELAPQLDLDEPVRVDMAMPHMHLLGRTIEILRHRDGVAEPIVSIPDYDFDWQRIYEPVEGIEVLPTDELEVRCVFDNTAEQRAATDAPSELVDVGWGEGTHDEMCAAILTVSQ